jgi:hypothetical protein
VPTTTPARTLLDLAPRLSRRQLTRLVNDERREGRVRPTALQDVIARNPYHPATKLLRPFAQTTTNPTASPFEDDFLAFITKYGLPIPEMNFPSNARKLDAYFPEHGVIAVRITKTRLDHTPDHEAARLKRILSRGAKARFPAAAGRRGRPGRRPAAGSASGP